MIFLFFADSDALSEGRRLHFVQIWYARIAEAKPTNIPLHISIAIATGLPTGAPLPVMDCPAFLL
jgi:hypothetical protein